MNLYEEDVMDYEEKLFVMVNTLGNTLGSNIMSTYTETEKQRTYLSNRLYDIYAKKDDQLQKEYGISDDPRPKNWGEMLDRLNKGLYVLPKEKEDDPYTDYNLSDIRYIIRWRDPKIVEDRKGYQIAHEALKKTEQEFRDKINILDPKDGLDALNAFAKTIN